MLPTVFIAVVVGAIVVGRIGTIIREDMAKDLQKSKV
jgi:hypothetical protein